jgi:hypothetical protein
MDLLLSDLASWTYIYNIIVGLYGFCIFAYWAVKQGGASSWYVYVMALLLSSAITGSFQLWARYLLLNQHDFYDTLLAHPVWAAKSWIASITITCISIHATYRLMKEKFSFK